VNVRGWFMKQDGRIKVFGIISKDGKKAHISADLKNSNHPLPYSVVIHLDALKGDGKTIKHKPIFPLTENIML
jgi:hypothetical protein